MVLLVPLRSTVPGMVRLWNGVCPCGHFAVRLVGQLLTVALLLGLALMLLLEFAGPELLHVLGATAANEDQARTFIVAGSCA